MRATSGKSSMGSSSTEVIPFLQDRIEALTGTATYTGDALAYYVDTNITGTDPVTGIGCRQGGPPGGRHDPDGGIRIRGRERGRSAARIHNFKQDEDLIISERLTTLPTELTLGSAPIGSSHSGFFKGNTSMTFDGSTFAGKWGGQFYGNDKPHGVPGSTAGTFGAATADGTKIHDRSIRSVQAVEILIGTGPNIIQWYCVEESGIMIGPVKRRGKDLNVMHRESVPEHSTQPVELPYL